MKNLLKLAVVAVLTTGTAYCDEAQTASEVVKRFEGVKKVFAEKGQGAIGFLNGINPGAANGKGGDNASSLEVGVDNFNDPDASLVCVGPDDTYLVHTSEPTRVGKSAVSGDAIWRDGVGIAVVEKARAALTGAHNGFTSIKFVQNTTMINPSEGKPFAENFSLAVADDRYIHGLPKGAFCGTLMQYSEPRGMSEADRLAEEPTAKKHSKHHAKKHKKVAEEKHTEAEKDTAKK